VSWPMPNHYFDHNTNSYGEDQALVDDLIQEAISIYGMQVVYIKRTMINPNTVLGESTINEFKKAYSMDMYFESVQGFGGGILIGPHGLDNRKECVFSVSKKTFNEVMKAGPGNLPPAVTNTKEVRPMEGDIIYLPMSNDLWEIAEANHEKIFYQIGQVYVWTLKCNKYMATNDTIDTGIPEIDKIGAANFNLDGLTNEPIEDNTKVETEAESIVNFSEKDPFSQGGI
jgi:neck protein